MLPGISGALISSAFLDVVVAGELASPDTHARLRRLHAWWRDVARRFGPASSLRAVADGAASPLVEALGFRLHALEPHGDRFVGVLSRGRNRVVLCVTTWDADADRAWRDTVRAGRTAGASWGLVFTGPALRIVDAGRTWSRRSLHFDLAGTLAHERSALALVRVLDAIDDAPEAASGLHALVQRGEAHGARVCAALGDGVLEALAALVNALSTPRSARVRRRHEPVPFEQAITIVYRLLFLLFAESRRMVPTWHQVYRDAYSIDALWRRAITSRPAGLWKALQAISRLAHAGCRAGDLIVTPFNGRLFSPRHTPLVEQAHVPDAVVGEAVVALATRPTRAGRERIAYSDLGVEQLGAVYERVLEYEPSAGAGRVALTRTSVERKATGSFYTPRSVTEFLVRRTLHPLVANRSPAEILALRVLDPAMGSGAFLVAACRYLAGAVEQSMIAKGDLAPRAAAEARPEIRRLVAQRCLYGVDRNPMAVQLARLSLWLTTLAPDRPLTFLDHHLAVGDSLVGAWIHDLPRSPRAGAVRSRREELPLFTDGASETLALRVLPSRVRLADEPDLTPDAVRSKERTLAALNAADAPLTAWKAAADLWCTAWLQADRRLTPGLYHDLVARLLHGRGLLRTPHGDGVIAAARTQAAALHCFHWELEFPEVFFDFGGRRDPARGFDAVIGNPPWEVLRADAGDRSTRNRARADHEAGRRFFRDAGVYRHQGQGHANRYQLFLERTLQVTRAGGRLGLILPSGLATDSGSAPLRRALLDGTHIDRLIGFDNREAIFPIHRDMRFLLLTATAAGSTERLTCAFARSDAAWLDALPDAAADDPPEARPLVLTRALLERWDPEHVAIPLLPGREDLSILAAIADAVPALGSAAGWNVRFGRELNASDDRPAFVARDRGPGPRHLPVVEGKHLEPFRVDVSSTTHAIPGARAAALLDGAQTFARARLAYRDVASATNRLTLIAAVLPRGTVSTHTLFCLKTPLTDDEQYCLLALLNSLVANYLVRLQVTTHVTAGRMARLPVPRPARSSAEFQELVWLARALERAGIMGDQRSYARLNAIVATLYGLTPDQYQHVVSTFPLLPETLRTACLAAVDGDATQKMRVQESP